MAINWPSSIVPNNRANPMAIETQTPQESPLTGSAQYPTSAAILYEASFTFAALTNAQMDLVNSVINRLKFNDLTIPIHRAEVDAASGSILVGSGATGTSLPVTGVNSGYAPKAGRWLSINHSGRLYLHSLAVDSAAGATSRTFTLNEVIRLPYSSGGAVNMEPPSIQGKAKITMPSLSPDGTWQGLQVTVREAR